jgi:glycosyltransferase involved in cell wall biosynthesis
MVVGAYYPELAGGSLQCRTLMEALRDHVDFSVLTTTADASRPTAERIAGVPVHRVFVDAGNPATKFRSSLHLLRIAPRLAASADIFHFHGFTQKMLVLFALARISGRRTIEKMTSVGWDDPVSIRSRPFGRWLGAAQRNVDRIVAVSPAMLERCRRARVAPDKIASIPNGVDANRFAPVDPPARKALRQRLKLPIDVPIVTFVGFWSTEKGPDVVFDAWVRARAETGIDAGLVYIGSTDSSHAEVDASLVDRVRRRITEDGLESRVFFVGRTDDVVSYLQAGDVFAVPSSREGLSNALLEAMATALPCITGAIPGVSDSVVEHGVNGFIVAPRDSASLALHLAALLRDEQFRQTIGARARRSVLSRFAIAHVADQYLALYRSLLEGNSPARN